MFSKRNLAVLLVLCIACVSGTIAEQIPFRDDLIGFIDYEKYLKLFDNQRIPKQLNQQLIGNNFECTDNACSDKVCADPENEVYQKCGNKCVPSCRYARSSAEIAVAKNDCTKSSCVEGCFCKAGLVRHQGKCITPTKCPIRECNQRNETYICGPAAAVTCDNALREEEIIRLTQHLECIWGCYCLPGFLRDNSNGRCVPEKECRTTATVDVLPQSPGQFNGVGCSNGQCNKKDEKPVLINETLGMVNSTTIATPLEIGVMNNVASVASHMTESPGRENVAMTSTTTNSPHLTTEIPVSSTSKPESTTSQIIASTSSTENEPHIDDVPMLVSHLNVATKPLDTIHENKEIVNENVDKEPLNSIPMQTNEPEETEDGDDDDDEMSDDNDDDDDQVNYDQNPHTIANHFQMHPSNGNNFQQIPNVQIPSNGVNNFQIPLNNLNNFQVNHGNNFNMQLNNVNNPQVPFNGNNYQIPSNNVNNFQNALNNNFQLPFNNGNNFQNANNQFPFSQNGNNFLTNQQILNNGAQNQFQNAFHQSPNQFNPNFGFNSNLGQNVGPNYQVNGFGAGGPQFVPQHFINQQQIPQRIDFVNVQNNKNKQKEDSSGSNQQSTPTKSPETAENKNPTSYLDDNGYPPSFLNFLTQLPNQILQSNGNGLPNLIPQNGQFNPFNNPISNPISGISGINGILNQINGQANNKKQQPNQFITYNKRVRPNLYNNKDDAVKFDRPDNERFVETSDENNEEN